MGYLLSLFLVLLDAAIASVAVRELIRRGSNR